MAWVQERDLNSSIVKDTHMKCRPIREQITAELVTTDTTLADTLEFSPILTKPITFYQIAANAPAPRLYTINFTLGGTGNKTITWLGTLIAMAETDTCYIDYWTED